MDGQLKPPKQIKGVRIVQIIACLLATLFNAFLFAYSDLSIPFLGGKLMLHPAYIFLMPLALWFGVWGAVSGYLGFLLGMTFAGIGSPTMNILWSLQAFWLAFIPLLAFRKVGADPGLNTKRDWWIFILTGWLIGNLISSFWGVLLPAIFRFWPWMMVSTIWIDWLAGNLLLTGTVTPFILNIFTKDARESGAYTHGIIT